MGKARDNSRFGNYVPVPPIGSAGQALVVNSGGDGLEFSNVSGSGGSGSSTFTGLTDTPSSFSGQGSKVVSVNSGGTALEFTTVSSGVSIKKTVTESNSFSAGNVVYRSGSVTDLSKSDLDYTAEVWGVIESASGANFSLVTHGELSLPSHGLGSDGDVLYVSETTGGLMTTTEPTLGISKPVGFVLDSNTIHVSPLRGAAVGDAVSSSFAEYEFSGDGSTVNYDLVQDIPGENILMIHVGQIYQPVSSYSIGLDGNSRQRRVTFSEAPLSGSNVQIRFLV